MGYTGRRRGIMALLFFLGLLVIETIALLTMIGVIPAVPNQGPVWYDAFWMAVAFGVLVVCDLFAAYMTFYVKVTPSPAKN